MSALTRVEIDPNIITGDGTTAVLYESAPTLTSGDSVLTVQTDDDGTCVTAEGRVEKVDAEYGLVYIRVDWDTYRDEGAE